MKTRERQEKARAAMWEDIARPVSGDAGEPRGADGRTSGRRAAQTWGTAVVFRRPILAIDPDRTSNRGDARS